MFCAGGTGGILSNRNDMGTVLCSKKDGMRCVSCKSPRTDDFPSGFDGLFEQRIQLDMVFVVVPSGLRWAI